MNDDHLSSMYGVSDKDDEELTTPMSLETRIVNKGIVTEIKVGETTVKVVDPIMVQRLENVVRILEQKLRSLENDMRNMKGKLPHIERSIIETKIELKSKISYD